MQQQKQQDTATSNDWSGLLWSCDELTPNFCELQATQLGELVVRGVKVKYWIYRRRQVLVPPLPPILVLHGGPGFPHNYLLPLKQQACQGRTVIFYDQTGCGESETQENFSWLLDPLYYAREELPALISHLQLEEYHIIAHSWGTMLAQLFALEQKPKGLKSMVLSGPLSDSKLWETAMWDPETGVLGQLPPFLQFRFKQLETDKMYKSPEYQAIDAAVTILSVCRTSPLPDCYQQSQQTMNKEIYVRMQGPSEFSNGGVLADFNTTGRLRELQFPVLLTYGKFDTISPLVVKTMQEQLPLSEVNEFPRSGHVSTIDQPGVMNYDVADFFDRVEAAGPDFVPRRRPAGRDDHARHIALGVLPVVLGIAIGLLLSNFIFWAMSRTTRRSRRSTYEEIS